MQDQALIGRRAAAKEDRRRTILQVAERSFMERGFGEASMSTIAAELGGSKTTLWSYFPSKEALFLAVLESKIEGFAAQLDAALVPTGGTAAALARFGRVFLARILDPASITLKRLLSAEGHRFPEICAAFYTRGPGPLRERLARFMREEMAGGGLRKGDPVLATNQFLALLQAGAYNDRLWHRPSAPEDIGRDVANAVDSFLRAWGAVSSARACSANAAG